MSKQFNIFLSSRIRTFRRREGASQDDFAHIMGISQSAYSEREAGRVAFSYEEIWRLCDAYGFDANYFSPPLSTLEVEQPV